MNRLKDVSSPYLLQHQHQPVDWWPWGKEAFASAQRLQKPVLLSIGYAACHWCHVMAHESFDDEDVASLMNDLFVSIKVDREERPDVDHLYMSALTRLGEAGGWPLTMFLTPAGEPFWGGTYFPKQSQYGRVGFIDVLKEISRLYHSEPDRIAKNKEALKAALSAARPQAKSGEISLSDLDRLGRQLSDLFDPVHGGLHGAPKFPNPTILEGLWRYARRTNDASIMALLERSLERMALGGVHDHLGGGFSRYCVDEEWLVPHFEKMLYDNAQLLELYAVTGALTQRALFKEAAEGIVAWLRRDMLTAEGAFASSLDADSEGEEGRFYVWNLNEIKETLGKEAEAFAAAYDVTKDGNWEGVTILNRLRSSDGEGRAPFAEAREKLLLRRLTRIPPARDDKILADWNGLMIAALVRAGLALDRPHWLDLARNAYRFVREKMTRDGRLGHSWRNEALVFPGFASDHAAMMRAALALHEATQEIEFLDDARIWSDVLLRDYGVPEDGGGLAMSAKDGDELILRLHPTYDEAVPNAHGLFLEALVRLAQLTGSAKDLATAEETLTAYMAIAQTAPLAHLSILNAADLHLRGTSIVVTEGRDERRLRDLRQAALALPAYERSVANRQSLSADHPAATLANEETQAFLCAGMRCSLPIKEAVDLKGWADEMRRASV